MLDLPLELRYQIYSEYLQDFYGSLPLHINVSQRLEKNQFVKIPALFFASRQIYTESRVIITDGLVSHATVANNSMEQIPSNWREAPVYIDEWVHRMVEKLSTARHARLTMGILRGPRRGWGWGYSDVAWGTPDPEPLTTNLNQLKRAIEMFCPPVGSEGASSPSDGHDLVKRSLLIDLDHLFYLGKWDMPGAFLDNQPFPLEWASVLSLVDECLRAARAGGDQDDLTVKLQCLKPFEKVGARVAEEINQKCEAHGVVWTMVEPEPKKEIAYGSSFWGFGSHLLLDSFRS